MTDYLLELYASQGSTNDARRLASAIADADDGMRYLATILVPADETCFCLIRASSASGLAGIAKTAGIQPERIAEVVIDKTPTPQG
jgi:hypothetical protein